ncbi:MAG: stage II sporulation protein E [Clostridia bacterium]|nr:stage II sporulation protein E [Clostridia bacterium]
MANLETSAQRGIYKKKTEENGAVLNTFLCGAIGLFLSMAVPYSGIAPFGISFLARERRLSVRTFLYFVVVCVGVFVVCDGADATKYIGAGLIYLAVLFVLERDVTLSVIAAGIISGLCVFFTGFIVTYWTGFYFENLLLLVFDSCFVFVGTLATAHIDKILRMENRRMGEYDTRERIGIGFVLVLLVLGLKRFEIGSDFSLMDMVAAVTVLVVAWSCGIAYSTGAGIVLGAACGIDTNFFMPVLGTFGLCGLISGALSKYGKGGVIGGFVASGMVLSAYTDGAMRAMLSVYEIMAAAVIFGLLPNKSVAWVKRLFCAERAEKGDVTKLKESLSIKLKSVASSFLEMSETLERLSQGKGENNHDDIAVVFDCAAERICKNCRKSDICWNKEAGVTYKALVQMMQTMIERGEVDMRDIDEKFKGKCFNLYRLTAEINHQFDLQRMKCVWQSKLDESRTLMEEQLVGVSEIMGRLSENVLTVNQESGINAADLNRIFEKAGIRVKNIDILEDGTGRYKVVIILRSVLWKDESRCGIVKIMREVYGCEISVRDVLFDEGRFVRVEFMEAEKFRVETDFACKSMSDCNGDNYRFSHIGGGKYVIALSDGMGTGSRASQESQAMLELLDSFLRAGFDSRMAVKFINSVMLLKSEESTFVTFDICIIDLYTGMAEFIKTGAEPSFVMRGSRVDTVRAGSLPVGIIADMEAKISKRKVEDGMVIVMMSDGLETRESGNLLWVGDFIKETGDNIRENNLAERILRAAIEKNGGKVKDDMTVLAVKLKNAV